MDFMATKTNWDEYDQAKPSELDLKSIRNISVPVALITAKSDLTVSLKDARWVRDQLLDGDFLNQSKTLVFYKEYQGGHFSFHVGKDMSYADDLLELLKTLPRYTPPDNTIEEDKP